MFIVLEGPDGAGKTTLAKALVEALPNAVYEQEPYDRESVYGAIKVDPSGAVHYFMEDRENHQAVIAGHLAEGKIVVCDRYYWSTAAYQYKHLIENPNDLRTFVWKSRQLIQPDVVFFVEANPTTLDSRRKAGGAHPIDAKFHSQWRQRQVYYAGYPWAFLTLPPNSLFCVDTDDCPAEEIAQDIGSILESGERSVATWLTTLIHDNSFIDGE